jgi:hypothetical protein
MSDNSHAIQRTVRMGGFHFVMPAGVRRVLEQHDIALTLELDSPPAVAHVHAHEHGTITQDQIVIQRQRQRTERDELRAFLMRFPKEKA